MTFGKYKNKAANGDIIYLVRDDDTSKWYAENVSKRLLSNFFESIDALRDGLRLNDISWYDFRTHIDMRVKLHMEAKKGA